MDGSEPRVKEVYRVSRNTEGGQAETGTVIITFEDTPPATILCGNRAFRVYQYVPRPNLCRHCWRLGHVSGACKARTYQPQPRCKRCSKIHQNQDTVCREPPRCMNCKGSHEADDKACQLYSFMQAALRVAQEEGLTVEEAKAHLSALKRSRENGLQQRSWGPDTAQKSNPHSGPQVARTTGQDQQEEINTLKNKLDEILGKIVPQLKNPSQTTNNSSAPSNRKCSQSRLTISQKSTMPLKKRKDSLTTC